MRKLIQHSRFEIDMPLLEAAMEVGLFTKSKECNEDSTLDGLMQDMETMKISNGDSPSTAIDLTRGSSIDELVSGMSNLLVSNGQGEEGKDDAAPDEYECPVCFEYNSPDSLVVTNCGHRFCFECIFQLAMPQRNQKDNHNCPMCREKLNIQELLSTFAARNSEGEEQKVAASTRDKIGSLSPKFDSWRGAKVHRLLKELKAIRTLAPTSKVVVFSRWTSMLDVIQSALDDVNIGHTRLDGSMSPSAQRQSLKRFREDEDVCAFLVSLKAGGVGKQTPFFFSFFSLHF